MNSTTKICPNCGEKENITDYHSFFKCGSYFDDGKAGSPTITENRKGYYFHETLGCSQNKIRILNDRLIKLEKLLQNKD